MRVAASAGQGQLFPLPGREQHRPILSEESYARTAQRCRGPGKLHRRTVPPMVRGLNA